MDLRQRISWNPLLFGFTFPLFCLPMFSLSMFKGFQTGGIWVVGKQKWFGTDSNGFFLVFSMKKRHVMHCTAIDSWDHQDQLGTMESNDRDDRVGAQE